ncbi:MAG TPA: TIGR03790 family protein [Steroidobacteraceae bacterium]|nr:TIGR03790 family protein [Steroidobacteraceae bacterium]
MLLGCAAHAQGLVAARLGVIYNLDDTASRQVALYYAAQRAIPPENLIGIHLPNEDVLSVEAFEPIRAQLLDRLPSPVQSLALIWSKPYAVGCMSITSAFAAGYRAGFCTPGCARTLPSPLFNADGWLPADTVGWWPAMLLPSDDIAFAKSLILRGIKADYSGPAGTLYLVRTSDRARNARARTYGDVEAALSHRLRTERLSTPILREIPDAIGYFTGTMHVNELPNIRFRPGAIADHLTSGGGILEGGSQMPATSWLRQGATASYGSVSEPCSFLEKFPNVTVLFDHYTHGETILEAYWKSVAMPGQGIFIGEPLSRPYASPSRSRQ